MNIINDNKKVKILYVEDEADIRDIVCDTLELICGYTVRGCCSGKQALIIINQFVPNLILLDVMMPGMDGIEVANKLQTSLKTKHIPIIFVTEKVRPDELERYKLDGVVDIIHKPFDIKTLTKTIINHVNAS